MHAADEVQAAIEATGSIAVVGLDPRVELIPPVVRRSALAKVDGSDAVMAAFEEFNFGVLAVVAGHCAAVKLQAACYEAYGSSGWALLERTVAEARRSRTPVIIDAKRGDIGSTATHYREAFADGAPDFGGVRTPRISANWLTVNGYLGRDGIEPFLERTTVDLGVFVVVRTSNPSSSEIQALSIAGGCVSDELARLVHKLGQHRLGQFGLSDVGAVVGATQPDDAARLRDLMPNALFLAPGYGTQGASASASVAGMRSDGRGVIVNSSRALIGAWLGADALAKGWQEAVQDALFRMNAELGVAVSAL